MPCTPAPAARALLQQASQRWPGRSTATDGICASPQHTKQNPTSSHETGNAVDLTADDAKGVVLEQIAEGLVQRAKEGDPRARYIIYNKKIRQRRKGWIIETYTGKNPHVSHLHVDIEPAFRDDTSNWFGGVPIDFDDQKGQGTDGSWIGPEIAKDIGAQAAEDMGVPGLGPLIRFTSFVTDPGNWWRVALFVLGLVLAVVAVFIIVADSKAGRQLAGAAAEVLPAGRVVDAVT